MRIVSAKELADELQVSVASIYRLTRQGRIPCLELGLRTCRYDLDAVLETLRARKNDPEGS